MNRLFTIVIIMAIPIALYLYMSGNVSFPFSTVFDPERPLIGLGDAQLNVDVFDTAEERRGGLSGRQSLAPHSGALFIFGESGYHGIWMKDMFISLDILWIDESFTVVHIERNVHPSTYPEVFEPPVPARFVLEVASQYTDSFNIQVGDTLDLPRALVPEDLRE